jgi:site-specific recombinase XerD
MNSETQNIGNKTPSTPQPKPQTKPEPMSYWQERFECHLLLNAKRSTFRRYARALDKFLDMNRDKTFGYQFLRPVIIDYVQARLVEGASVSTVRLEMAAVRGLFAYMIQMGAVDVMFNPAANVRVPKLTRPIASIQVNGFPNPRSGGFGAF